MILDQFLIRMKSETSIGGGGQAMSGFRSTLIKNVIRNEYGEVRETMNDFISNLNKNVVGNEHWGRRAGQD